MFKQLSAPYLVRPTDNAHISDSGLPAIVGWENYVYRESNATAEAQTYTERDLARKLYLSEFDGMREAVILQVNTENGEEMYTKPGVVVLNPLGGQKPYFVSNHNLTWDWVGNQAPVPGDQHFLHVPEGVCTSLIKLPPSRRVAMTNDHGVSGE